MLQSLFPPRLIKDATRIVVRLTELSVFLLTCFSLANLAHADEVVNSAFVFQLNDSFFNTPEFEVLSQLQGSQTFTLPDTTIQDIAPVAVSGISGSVSYALTTNTPQIYLGAELTLASKQFTVTMNVAQISVNSMVTTVSGGTEVDTLVQGTCTNIPLTLQQGAGQLVGTVLTSIDANGLPTVTVPWFEANWAPTAWTIGNFSCTGVAGFSDRVRTGLVKYLGNASQFNAKLKALVQAQAATYQTKVQQLFTAKRSFAVGINGLTVTMTPQALQTLDGENFQVTGVLGFDFVSPTVNKTVTIPATSASPATLRAFALLIPNGLISALNTAAYATGFYNYQTAGQQLSGFQNLLASGLEDFFVWPELAYYPASSNFTFGFSASSPLSLSSITDNQDGSVSQAFSGGISANVYAPTSSPSLQQLMTNFNGPVTGAYTLSLNKTSTATQLQAAFSQIVFNLAATWDPIYVATVMRNSYINVGILQTNVASSIQSAGYAISLSPMALTSSLSLSPTSLQTLGDWLEINWGH